MVMEKLNDYTLIDVLHDLLVEIRSLNSRLDEIERKLDFPSSKLKLNETKRVLNFSEAAEYISTSKSNLYKMTSLMRIPYSKPSGKCIFFEKEKLDEWLLRNPHKTIYEIEEEARNFRIRSGRRK